MLGASYAYPDLRSAADFNNFMNTGFVLVYTIAITDGIQNAPNNIAYGYLEINEISKSDVRIVQRYYIWGHKSYYAYRYREGNLWGNWNYV